MEMPSLVVEYETSMWGTGIGFTHLEFRGVVRIEGRSVEVQRSHLGDEREWRKGLKPDL